MLLIDNNLSSRLVGQLRDSFPNCVHVADIGLDDKDDFIVWNYAVENDLHILTKDGDFNGLQSLKGFPPKIIWIRIGNASTKIIIQVLQENADKIKTFLQNETIGILELR